MLKKKVFRFDYSLACEKIHVCTTVSDTQLDIWNHPSNIRLSLIRFGWLNNKPFTSCSVALPNCGRWSPAGPARRPRMWSPACLLSCPSSWSLQWWTHRVIILLEGACLHNRMQTDANFPDQNVQRHSVTSLEAARSLANGP